MAFSKFSHVKMTGIKTIIPENVIDIDSELEFYGNQAKLDRLKKLAGFNKRYVVDEYTTVVDLCECAANKLIEEISLNKNDIDALIVVNQSPDYLRPASSCVLHGRLGLKPDCATFDINLGCSGYVYALWVVHSLIESAGIKKALLLAGDNASTHTNIKNRKTAPIFGDAASASIFEYSEKNIPSYFLLGSDGSGWNKIIAPAGGFRFPIKEDVINKEITDNQGNIWHFNEDIIKGQDIFAFSVKIAPQIITNLLAYSGKFKDDIDYFVIHQANKQIVDTIISKLKLPLMKSSSDTFSKYGNNSTTSVATVICDQLLNKNLRDINITTFGVGLSWGGAIIDIKDIYNGGISFFETNSPQLTREEQINYWANYFKEG